MLNLILGRAGCGKSKRICEIIKETIDKNEKARENIGEENIFSCLEPIDEENSTDNDDEFGGDFSDIVFVAPEQFTFECEKRFLNVLGPRDTMKVSIVSFTSLSSKIQRQYAKTIKPSADQSSRQLLMAQTLDDLQDELVLFSNCQNSSEVISEISSTLLEASRGAVSFDEIKLKADLTGNETLIRKVNELKLINELFTQKIEKNFTDTRFTLDNAQKLIAENKSFVGKTVFFDEFYGFTLQQFNLMCEIAKQAKNVYVAFSSSGVTDNTYGTGPFSYTIDSIHILERKMREAGVDIAKPEILTRETRYSSKAIQHLEENIYDAEDFSFDEKTEDVKIIAAENPIDECEIVAFTSKKLVRECGYRYRDIAVIDRDGSYDEKLYNAFRKYDIPIFEDVRYHLDGDLTIKFILSSLNLAIDGLKTENILTMLKTGLTDFTLDDVLLLENYCLIWQIDNNKWRTEFTLHPDGYNREFDESTVEILSRVNEMRSFVVDFADDLREKLKFGTATDNSRVVYEMLENMKIAEKLEKIGEESFNSFVENYMGTRGLYTVSRIKSSWDVTVKILDSFSLCLGQTRMSARRFVDLFALFVQMNDVGQMPAGIDEITVGRADRIRVANKKVVFLVGANESVFPKISSSGFVLTKADRRLLQIDAFETTLQSVQRERFFAYTVLSTPSEKLYISYCKCDMDGSQLRESEIVTQTRKILPSVQIVDSANIDVLDRIESVRSAFEVASKLLGATENEKELTFSKTASKFIEETKYSSNLRSAKRARDKTPLVFENSVNSLELYGKKMTISPSRVEEYYKCPFGYFCNYTLNESQLKPARLDSTINGTLIHFVLEQIIKYDKDKLEQMSDEDIFQRVESYCAVFSDENLDGNKAFSKREQYVFNHSKKILNEVVRRIKYEMINSDFKPLSVEQQIGFEDGNLVPHTVIGDDNTQVSLVGKVDRIDVWDDEETNTLYVKIVDYKSGKKDFDIREACSGLNDQMIIYLNTICENFAHSEKQKYLTGESTNRKKVLPAAMLYMGTRDSDEMLGRNSSDEQIEEKKITAGQMKGLVANNERIINALDKTGKYNMIPVTKGKDGNIKTTNSTLTISGFRTLFKNVDDVVLDMAHRLQGGDVAAKPMFKGNNPIACEYCEYKTICMYEDGDDHCVLSDIKRADIEKQADETKKKQAENVIETIARVKEKDDSLSREISLENKSDGEEK